MLNIKTLIPFTDSCTQRQVWCIIFDCNCEFYPYIDNGNEAFVKWFCDKHCQPFARA